jgi:ring-1,2-phenylacetyl-CoA epoxidase subunit PaaA
MSMLTDEQLRQRVAQGGVVERPDEMTPAYRYELKRMLLIAGDTEFRSVPMLCSYLRTGVPYRYVKPVLAIAQDELGHAHVDYRVLEELGEDVDALIHEREADQWIYPYFFDMPIDNWYEVAVAEGLGEFAGGLLVRNVYHYTSYAPWRRALAKVDLEEDFHVKFGQTLMRELARDDAHRQGLQRAVDWMFPLLLEFFGPPAKADDPQIHYRLKGRSTDELRAAWLAYAVPFCQHLGLQVPAQYIPDTGCYTLTFPFPCAFDETAKRWDFGCPVDWKVVFARWKRRGPMAGEHLRWIRQGRRSLQQWLARG